MYIECVREEERRKEFGTFYTDAVQRRVITPEWFDPDIVDNVRTEDGEYIIAAFLESGSLGGIAHCKTVRSSEDKIKAASELFEETFKARRKKCSSKETARRLNIPEGRLCKLVDLESFSSGCGKRILEEMMREETYIVLESLPGATQFYARMEFKNSCTYGDEECDQPILYWKKRK